MQEEGQAKKKIGVLDVFKWVGIVVGGIALVVLIAFLFGYFVMLLWNWLMPELFGLKQIDYWQAFGIIILAKLIFGSIGGGGHDGNKSKKNKHSKGDSCWDEIGEEISLEFEKEFESCGKDWSGKGGHKNWKHYKSFWKEEGKKAFEDYITRKEEEKKSEPSE